MKIEHTTDFYKYREIFKADGFDVTPNWIITMKVSYLDWIKQKDYALFYVEKYFFFFHPLPGFFNAKFKLGDLQIMSLLEK